MSGVGEILVRTGVAVLVALAGAALGIALGRALGQTSRLLGVLVSVAGGALLAVTLVALMPEAAHLVSPALLVPAILAGALVFHIVGRYVSPICPACATDSLEPPDPLEPHGARNVHRLGESAALLMVALTLHSIMDGAALAAGHELHDTTDLSLLLAVSLHKLPEGLALATLLLGAGYAPRAAFWATAGVEMMTLVGGVAGALVLPTLPSAGLGALLAFVVGGFLYLIVHALRGGFSRLGAGTSRAPGALGVQVACGLLGFGSVAVLLWGVGRLAH